MPLIYYNKRQRPWRGKLGELAAMADVSSKQTEFPKLWLSQTCGHKPKEAKLSKTLIAALSIGVIVVETLERSLRLKTQCAHQLDSGSLGCSDLSAHQLDSGSLGCSDLQSRFSSLGFSEAAEPSVGKMGTSSCPSCAMDNLIDTDPGSMDNLINTDLGVHNNDSKRYAFWSLNEDILKITILKTNTPYPSRKIGVSVPDSTKTTEIKFQYVYPDETQYAVFKIIVCDF
ncbi:hypothetical protein Tco_0689679 [Tanacetum coccineum]